MDVTLYMLLGVGLVGVVLVAWFRPAWLKFALVGFGLLAGAAVVQGLRDRQKRLRELGATEAQAGAIARITVRAEELRKKAAEVGRDAERDQELQRLQDALVQELQGVKEGGGDADAILAEVKRHFSGL